MTPSRATLAMTGLLLCVLSACADQTVVPTEPSRVAPLTSIPGSSSATVRTGSDGERFVQEVAAEWQAAGDHSLAEFLKERDRLDASFSFQSDSRRIGVAPSTPNLVIRPGDEPSTSGDQFPSPSTAPNAIIYHSSVAPFVSGSNGVILASVTYYGNIAATDVTYRASASDGSVVLPSTKVSNRGLGENAPCTGSAFQCSWTFRLQTVVGLSLGRDCGVTLRASGNHRAEWTIPAFRFPGATWGTAFAANGETPASNSACTQPPPTTLAGGGDASSPPSTGGTTQPPTYQPAPFVPSGHWECVVYFMGTDYEKEYCTWYADNAAKMTPSSAAFVRLGATDVPSAARGAADLPSVFVIVSDQLPAGASAVVERHTDGPYRNVLLLPSSAIRPATLVAALRALAESRARHGEAPAKELQLILRGTVLDQHIPAAAREHAAGFTALIAGAKRANAGTYGTRPVLEILLADR